MTTTDLYVSTTGSDSNAGTQTSPFKTILAASLAAQPGTTVHVAPGTYDGGFTTTTSGTAASPIHYVSDTPGGAKIVPGLNSTYDMGWDNRGAYVAIDGFEVDGTNNSGTQWRLGIYSTGSYSVIEHNNVHNIAGSITSQGGAGIEGDSYYGGSHIDLIGNVVHDIGPTSGGNTIQGIYENASGNVTNNLEYRAAGWGIALWHDANHVNIVNNTVLNNSSGGISVGGGDFIHTSGPDDYTVVANNIVYNNRIGIDEYGVTGTHNVYTHNLVSHNATAFSLQHGLTASNTITADPKLVTGVGNYDIASGSPAIDAGTETNAPTTDLVGHARPHGAGVDIGAYEYMSTGSTGTTVLGSTSGYNNPALSDAAWQAYSKAEITTQKVISGAILNGYTSSTILHGTDGTDRLMGHGAPTEFVGGYGRDSLWGGTGKNTFTYLSAADSTLQHADGVGNFHDARDVIDLHFLTAADNPGAANHQPLSFIGSNAFTGAGNQVHVIQNVAKNMTYVEADLSGHGQADLHIEIGGLHHLTAANFWL